MNIAARRPASPYARRLARERGIDIAGLAGSGPGGRIVAADIAAGAPTLEAVPVVTQPAAAAASAAPAAPPAIAAARAMGAFATTIDLAPLAKLTAEFGVDLPLGAFLVKAASRAAGPAADLLAWRPASAPAVAIARASTLAPTEIARLLAVGASLAHAGKPLVLSHITARGVRPVSASLPADADLRIVVSAAAAAESGEALLIYDESAIGEAEAAKILQGFRDLIESPFRLLV